MPPLARKLQFLRIKAYAAAEQTNPNNAPYPHHSLKPGGSNMSNVHLNGPIAYLSESKSAVYFSRAGATAGTDPSRKNMRGTAMPIQKLQNELDVAFWGEDNRFPQNIEQQLSYCGVGKTGLDWKARMLYGNGIVPGKVAGSKDDGSEIFIPLDRAKEKAIYDIIEHRSMFRFWMEFLQDWTWFGNCFPEVIFSKDCSKITGFVHQESCDSRFKQMDTDGSFPTVYLSKMWGASTNQYAKFDPKKRVLGLIENPQLVDMIDKKFLKTLDSIDMYDATDSAKAIAAKLKSSKAKNDLKSAILPVNYPSVNKTYYQVPSWDGARLAGWVEIASKIPSLIKTLYAKAFSIRYHIEIPKTYFEDKFGIEVWTSMDESKQVAAKKDLLREMDKFLSGSENAFKSFVSFFDVATQGKEEYGRIKINAIADPSTLDKEMITQSAADSQILVAMGINPALSGAGKMGTGQQRSGGSDLRENYLIYCAGLNLERQVFLEPLYLMRDFNGWDSDIVFRVRDTVLTTLDTGAGTKKTLS